jgi:hypothetical protein
MTKERQTLAERRLSLIERIVKAADEIKRIDNKIYFLQNKKQEQ